MDGGCSACRFTADCLLIWRPSSSDPTRLEVSESWIRRTDLPARVLSHRMRSRSLSGEKLLLHHKPILHPAFRSKSCTSMVVQIAFHFASQRLFCFACVECIWRGPASTSGSIQLAPSMPKSCEGKETRRVD